MPSGQSQVTQSSCSPTRSSLWWRPPSSATYTATMSYSYLFKYIIIGDTGRWKQVSFLDLHSFTFRGGQVLPAAPVHGQEVPAGARPHHRSWVRGSDDQHWGETDQASNLGHGGWFESFVYDDCVWRIMPIILMMATKLLAFLFCYWLKPNCSGWSWWKFISWYHLQCQRRSSCC